MKYLILLLLSFNVSAIEFDVQKHLSKTYITVGAGYKVMESIKSYSRDITDYSVYGPVIQTFEQYKSSPISARIEIGYQYSRNLSFGISHHSQWLVGWPIDDKKEYSKTEVFVDYTFWLN